MRTKLLKRSSFSPHFTQKNLIFSLREKSGSKAVKNGEKCVNQKYLKTPVAALLFFPIEKFLTKSSKQDYVYGSTDHDNMCNVTRLRLLQGPLALPEPFPTIFLDVNKVIDELHIKSQLEKVVFRYLPSNPTFFLI